MKAAAVFAVAFVALAACEPTIGDIYTCRNPDKGHKDANGEPDPCHDNDPDGGDAGDASDGGDAGDAGNAKPPGATRQSPCFGFQSP